jgi:cytochrome P450
MNKAPHDVSPGDGSNADSQPDRQRQHSTHETERSPAGRGERDNAETAATTRPTFDWDPDDPGVLENIRSTHDRMRERCPVAFSKLGWSVFRYDDVLAVLNDHETFKNDVAVISDEYNHINIPLFSNPPEHTMYRRSLSPFLNPKKILEFEPQLRELAITLLSPIIASGTADVLNDYADPYFIRSLCLFLGWEGADWKQIRTWIGDHMRHTTLRNEPIPESESHLALRAYIQRQIDTKRARPQDDLTSWLIQHENDDVQLDDKLKMNLLRTMLLMAYQPTTWATQACLRRIARDQELQDQLRTTPELIADAIEEVLRLNDVSIDQPRRATRDTEIGGRKIRAGDRVGLSLSAANRDGYAFQEPDRCVVGRKPNRHVVFGSGIHYCLGASLVRMKLRITVEEILARTVRLSLGPRPDLAQAAPLQIAAPLP